jgi:hypothetical protein
VIQHDLESFQIARACDGDLSPNRCREDITIELAGWLYERLPYIYADAYGCPVTVVIGPTGYGVAAPIEERR